MANCLGPRAVVAYPEVLRQAVSASTKVGVMLASAEVSFNSPSWEMWIQQKHLVGLHWKH